MSAPDLMLPSHLYMEKRDEHGNLVDVIYLHDRLMNWFDHGRGITRLCEQVYNDQLDRIGAWEDHQLLLLEEQWHAIETGEDDDDNEAQYHLACEAVVEEAEDRRVRAREERDQRRRAIEGLVADCSRHLEDNAPEPYTSHAAEYTLAIMLAAVLALVLL